MLFYRFHDLRVKDVLQRFIVRHVYWVLLLCWH